MKARLLSGASVLLLLSACGGGGSGGSVASTPPPAPAPTPTPVAAAPTPAPAPLAAPTVSYDTAEYHRSGGVVQANAITAYQAGATGRGVTVGVMDSGIDVDSPEFAGRIARGSADIAGSRGLQDEAGHGTAVSAVLLGAKNEQGTHGMAFDATLLVLRTDTPGSCATTGDTGGCKHSDVAMGRALDRAIAEGARVVNISLGGVAAGSAFRAAVGRATAAGMVVVISAGNDAKAEVDPLASIANEGVARGQIVIAGAVDANREIADFSNRAGASAGTYLTALGVRVRAPDAEGTAFLYNGTSFAAPQIAGAAALLAQAFPNLTGRQIVELLFASASDAGAAGTDAIYGRGVLDVGRAFRPIGATTLAGGTAAVSLGDNGALSAPMGDAGGARGLGAVVLDGFDRAFAVELAGTVSMARAPGVLAPMFAPDLRAVAARGGATAVALQIAGRDDETARRLSLSPRDALRAQATAGMVASRLGARTGIAMGLRYSGATLAASLDGQAGPAFLVARDGVREAGFERIAGEAAAVRHQLGRLGLWTSAERGDTLLPGSQAFEREAGLRPATRYSAIAVGADRAVGAVRFSGTVTQLAEDGSVLGARLGPLFGSAGARTLFADLGADAQLGGGWRLGAGVRQGWTRVGAGGAAERATTLRSSAWRLDIGKPDLFADGDSFGLRISQPLRISGGSFALTLPTGWDYETRTATMGVQDFGVAPDGREIDLEATYGRALLGGRIDANLFWRQEPGNLAWMPDDRGAVVRFSRVF